VDIVRLHYFSLCCDAMIFFIIYDIETGKRRLEVDLYFNRIESGEIVRDVVGS